MKIEEPKKTEPEQAPIEEPPKNDPYGCDDPNPLDIKAYFLT